jgi:hypothetical protein
LHAPEQPRELHCARFSAARTDLAARVVPRKLLRANHRSASGRYARRCDADIASRLHVALASAAMQL